ncbi:MAG: hypothetical protein AAB544_04495 [Patescibacteria group bacterium]
MHIRLLMAAILIVAPAISLASSAPASAPSQQRGDVTLMAPLGTAASISPGGNALFDYFTESLGWLQEVAVGVVILWLLFAGVMIMISGNDQGKRTQAKEHAVAAIIGLVMLFLFGFILSVLNASFFQQ